MNVMDILVMGALWGIGMMVGAACTYAILRRRHSGWLSLPLDSKLVLTVDGSGIGHFWQPVKMLPDNQVEMPGGNGIIRLEEGSAVFLPKMGVKLFLHYADCFRTIKAKHGAAFTFFRGKPAEALINIKDDDVDGKAVESTERQAENQPENGVVFDLRDVMHWVRGISPAQQIEGAIAAGIKYSGVKELILGSDEAGTNWKLLGLLAIAGVGVFVIWWLFGR